jgi:plastocyanin
MKKLLITLLTVSVVINLNAQQIFVISHIGVAFNPANVIVNQGDIVRFTSGTVHPVLEVSQSTWNSDGTTALPGGFSFPSGTGDYTTVTTGVHYFVCTAHVAAFGMKGTITVNMITGINDIQAENEGKVFPNPAQDFIIYQANRNSIVQEIRILDITSRSVVILQKPYISNDQVRIDIGNLNKGIYFMIVKSETGIISRKFIKS